MLSETGAAWLNARLERAFAKHGRVKDDDLPDS
jgi:hypothetical protein